MVIVLICDRFSGKLKVNFIQHAIISLFVGFSTSTGLVFKTFYIVKITTDSLLHPIRG